MPDIDNPDNPHKKKSSWDKAAEDWRANNDPPGKLAKDDYIAFWRGAREPIIGVAGSTFDAVAYHLSAPDKRTIDASWLYPRLSAMTVAQLDALIRSLVYRRMRGGFRVPEENIDLIAALIRGRRP